MKKAQRILALIGIIVLVGLYITTFVASIINTEFSQQLFTASLYCTVIIPIMLYAYSLIYKVVKNKKGNDQE